MREIGGARFAGSSPPFLGRERAAVDVDVKAQRQEGLMKNTARRLFVFEREVGFIENTARRHRRGG